LESPTLPAKRSRAINAAVLTSFSFAAQNAIRLVNNLVLSFLLAPEIFGLMAIANITVQAVQMFLELGIGTFLVQHKRGEEPAFVNTAWTVQVIRGPIVAVFVCLLAYPLSRWYREPAMFEITLALSLVPVFQCAGSTAVYMAGRRLELGRLTLLELGAQLLSCSLMCLAAWSWGSVWALVLGTIAGTLFFSLGSHLFLKGPGNRLAWNRDAASAIFHFGKWVTFGTAVTFFALQTDRLVLGKLGTLAELGLYHLAMSIAALTPMTVSRLAAVVQFPLLSEAARKSQDELASTFKKTRRPLLWIGLALSLGGVVGGPLLFDLLYEERYRPAGLIVQMMFVVTWFTVLSKSVDRSFVAIGDTRLGAFAMFGGVIAFAIGSALGYQYAGLAGFCAGAGCGAVINHLILYPALKHHGLTCIREDLVFTVIAFMFLAAIYWVQNSLQIASWANAGVCQRQCLANGSHL
jgi:O-antigen/teichoic acid export membrane protein